MVVVFTPSPILHRSRYRKRRDFATMQVPVRQRSSGSREMASSDADWCHIHPIHGDPRSLVMIALLAPCMVE